ncbi:hypothetical protein ACG33_01610 [Steroidobacter denitrificans]|uniref:Tail sheath protein subtilisin-like domain-containing protein n=1 Tax=Steroidobacter denitrificans TaxID=465721 RepID=A0A127F5V8_STEDE|nr:hypothetical protein ACG33_01610 [Steroidobacter denitrificans]
MLTAFVGRCLRGPLNQPILVRSFADFQRYFGGLWQPSTLSYALEHFFEQGGQQAIVVRIANGARPVSLTLNCGRERLILEARAPGTREFLRAAVDYDQIDALDTRRFNLVIQRVRAPGSEWIEEQETFRGLTIDADSARFVATVLEDSALVRVHGEVPAARPDRTLMPGTNLPVGYVSSSPDGDDGRPISDYDVIGSAVRRSGLFALAEVDELAFLHVPPLTRTAEVGISTLLVAARFCRERRAMLIVDPPANWMGTKDMARALKHIELRSDNAVMFHPRVTAMDRLRGRLETFGNGGAVAGLLSRSGDAVSAALTSQEPEPLLRAGMKLSHEIDDADRWLFAAHGVNVLQTVRRVPRERLPLRTLACGASASPDGSYLAQRRLALFTINAIERGTRWCLSVQDDASAWGPVTRQVRTFLGELRGAGAFASVPFDQSFLVICDDRINVAGRTPREVNILVQFAATRPGEYHSFMITHSVAHRAARVRPVLVNRLEASLIVTHQLEHEVTIRLRRMDAVNL